MIHLICHVTACVALLLASRHARAQDTDTAPATLSPPKAPANIADSDAATDSEVVTDGETVTDSEAPSDSHTPMETELVILAGFLNNEEIDIVRQSIISQLGDLDTNVVIQSRDVTPTATDDLLQMTRQQMSASGAAIAFIVMQGEAGLHLKIIRNTAEGVTVTDRPVTATKGSPQHEALAVIIRATVLAIREPATESTPTLTDSQPPGKAPSKLIQPPVPTTPTPVPRRPARQLFAESALAIGNYSTDTSVWLGALVGLGWSPLGHLVIHANYIFFAQVEKRTSALTLRLKRHPIYIGLRLSKLWRNFALGGGIALNIDIVTENTNVTESTTPDTPSLDPKSEGPSHHLGLHCYVQAVGHITDNIHIFIRPGIDIPLRHTQYSIDGEDEDVLIIQPLLIQPVVLIGIQLDII